MKRIILLAIVLFSSLAYAQETDLIRVLDLHYEKGDINIIESVLKPGHYPDRNVQPENGYTLEIISKTGNKLYEVIFEPPIKIFHDVSDENGDLSGGIIFLDEASFGMIIPYFNDEAEINIYNEERVLVEALEVIRNPALSPKQGIFWSIMLIFLIPLAVILWKRKHSENHEVRRQYPGWRK